MSQIFFFVFIFLWCDVTCFSCRCLVTNVSPRQVNPSFFSAPSSDSEDCDHIRNNSNSSETSMALRDTLRTLAQLSLVDYEWRSSIFKSSEADRLMENSIARMRGQDPGYVRPMDAASLGPLGRWEKAVVEWLSLVIDEEGKRAQAIVNQDGNLVRPMFSDTNNLGPLGRIEKAVVDLIHRIQNSEAERVKAGVLRPKDMVNSRGPLSEMEEEAMRILDEINRSERLRAEQSRARGGEIVRPIDVPGPLGELELKVAEVFRAEQMRSQQKQWNEGKIVRPKDARIRGPLGEAELQAFEAIKELNNEELQRLKSIQRVLEQNRPMETNRNSLLGILEAVIVGLLKGPRLLISVFKRVQELLQSEPLDLPDTSNTLSDKVKKDDQL
ncbi:hypothetical protein MPSEU_000105100 [Mayamaea pseudoterrestris]|nr:hypothetical protein MPSEU_000105100 [Mayamaea pseudoterrestris]